MEEEGDLSQLHALLLKYQHVPEFAAAAAAAAALAAAGPAAAEAAPPSQSVASQPPQASQASSSQPSTQLLALSYQRKCRNPNHHMCCDDSSADFAAIDNAVVAYLIDELFCLGQEENVCCMDLRDDRRGLDVLHGPTQAGKTESMLKVAWYLHFKRNISCCMFLRSDAATYAEMQSNVAGFNNKITQCLGNTAFHGNVSAYHIKVVCTTDRAGIQSADLEARRCVLYCRISSAMNFRNTVRNEMPKLIRNCGMTAEGKMRVCLLLDEDQLNIQSSSLNRCRREFQLHAACYREDLFDTVKQQLQRQLDNNSEKVEEILDAMDQSGWTLLNLARFKIGVSATCAPRFVTTDEEVQVTSLPPAGNYYGYLGELPADRQIALVPCLPETYVRIEEHGQGHPLNQFPHLRSVGRSVFARPGFEHLLVYCQVSQNKELFEIAEWLLWNETSASEPVFACINIGSSQHTDFGGVIIGNNTQRARNVLRLVAEADAMLFKPKDRGQGVPVGAEHQGRRVMHGAGRLPTLGGTCVDDPEKLPTVGLPKTMCYRIRTQLDLLAKACELAGEPLEGIKIMTVGSNLLKEGVTCKTSNHQFAATAMVLAGKSLTSGQFDHVRLLQLTGRLCGPRTDHRKPELFAAPEVLSELQKANALHCELLLHMRSGPIDTFHPTVTHLAMHPVPPRIVPATRKGLFSGTELDEPLDAAWPEMHAACMDMGCSLPKDVCWRLGNFSPRLPQIVPDDLLLRAQLYDVYWLRINQSPRDAVASFVRLALTFLALDRIPPGGLPLGDDTDAHTADPHTWLDMARMVGLDARRLGLLTERQPRETFARLVATDEGLWQLAPQILTFCNLGPAAELEDEVGKVMFSPHARTCSCGSPVGSDPVLLCSNCKLLFHKACLHNAASSMCDRCYDASQPATADAMDTDGGDGGGSGGGAGRKRSGDQLGGSAAKRPRFSPPPHCS